LFYSEKHVFDEYYEELELINLRHLFLRFKDFIKYSDKDLQRKILKKGYKHLNNNFNNWKNNRYFHGKKRITKYKFFWEIIILLPIFIKKIILKGEKV